MKDKREESAGVLEIKVVICPRCNDERTFVLETSHPRVYSCTDCKQRVAEGYFKYQEVFKK